MNERVPPRQVPTLTEVLADAAAVPAPSVPAAADLATDDEQQQLVERVLGGVQRQVDLMLEQRLREMLAPVTARLAETLLEECRDRLAPVLRELIARAVEQELERQRQR